MVIMVLNVWADLPVSLIRVRYSRSLILLFIIATSLLIPDIVSGYQSTYYFHNISELSVSMSQVQIGSLQIPIKANPSSSSARVFQESNQLLLSAVGTTLPLTSTIFVPASGSQPSGYAAVVAWLTAPFQSTVKFEGDVIMHVWMSSNDELPFWEGSQYFMGVADYSSDSKLDVIATYFSSGVPQNVFTPSAKEYTGSMRINQHDFQSGSRLMFFAGAGSTKQGWKFTVYFDSQNWNSRADVPIATTTTVTSQGTSMVTTSIATSQAVSATTTNASNYGGDSLVLMVPLSTVTALTVLAVGVAIFVFWKRGMFPIGQRTSRKSPNFVAHGGKAAAGLVCPRCGFMNRQGAMFCTRDRTPLASIGMQPKKSATPTQPGINLCPNCSATNRAGASFCTHCRTRLR